MQTNPSFSAKETPTVWLGFSFCDKVTDIYTKYYYHEDTNKEKEDIKMSVINVNKENFRQEVLESDKPVLMDFWASWCGPCRMVLPIIDEIAEENPDIKVVKVNVDEEIELASQFGVMSIPALFVMKNGEIVNQAVGAKSKIQLLDMVK